MPIYLNIWLTVKNKDEVARVSQLLAKAARLSRTEPGCQRFEVYQSQHDPSRFLLHEHWESQAALDAHRTAEAYTTIYQPHVLPLVEREGHPCTRIE
jgi:quinol monooxygenase YgiN